MNRLIALLATACGLLLAGHWEAHAATVPMDPGGQWTWLVGDTPGGALQTRRLASGEVLTHYRYTDNGRGPDLRLHWRPGQGGVPEYLRLRGITTYGSRAREDFQRDVNGARWRTVGDAGAVPSGAVPDATGLPAAYLPMVVTPDYLAALVRAALAAGGRLALLPAGELVVRQLETVTLAATSASSFDVNLYAISGLGVQPDYLWLLPDGALFASLTIADGTYGVIAQGWESALPHLAERQRIADAAMLGRLARETRHAWTGPVVLREVRVFDARSGALGDPVQVVVAGGRIRAVHPMTMPVPAGAWVVEGAGRTLLPGLIDMHTHHQPWGGPLHLAAGVTHTRDLGNDHRTLLLQESRFRSGEWLGPGIWRAGFMDGRSPFTASGGKTPGTLAEALTDVDFFAANGYRELKLYSSFPPEWIVPVAARAHERGLWVGGHVPAFTTASRVITQGYDELNHLNMLFLNFVADPGEDTRTIARFTIVGERGADLDLDSVPVREFVDELSRRKIVIDPTMACFEDSFNQAPGEKSRVMAAALEHLPAAFRRRLLQPEMELSSRMVDRYRGSWKKMLQLLKRLDDAGVTLVPGTDSWEGFAMHRELELWAEAGIAPAKVLQQATLGSARVLHQEHERGVVEPGFVADLVLVDGNPLQDLSVLRRAALVMKGGTVLFPAEIYTWLGIRPFTAAPLVRTPPGS